MITITQRVCSCCKVDMDTGVTVLDSEVAANPRGFTHGLCPECFAKEMLKLKDYTPRRTIYNE